MKFSSAAASIALDCGIILRVAAIDPFDCAANELHAFAGEKGIHWRRSRRSASFCRFQGRLSVDMTLSGDTNPKFAILSFRPPVSRHAGFLFRAVPRDYSFCVYTVTNRNSERCLHPFGFAANELQAFCGASGVRVMPTSGTPQMPSTPNAQCLNGTTPI